MHGFHGFYRYLRLYSHSLTTVSGYLFCSVTVVKAPILGLGGTVKDIGSAKQKSEGTAASSVDLSKLKIRLYCNRIGPSCGIARAFLDYYGFPYEVTSVKTVTTKQPDQSVATGVHFAEVEGQPQLRPFRNTALLVSTLKSYLLNDAITLPEAQAIYTDVEDAMASSGEIDSNYDDAGVIKKQSYFIMADEKGEAHADELTLERKWRKIADHGLSEAIVMNLCRSYFETVAYLKNRLAAEEADERIGFWKSISAVYVKAYKIRSKYNVASSNVREDLHDCVRGFIRTIRKRKQKFCGGNEPNLGDLAFYGALSIIEETKNFDDLQENVKFRPWYDRMKHLVDSHAGASELFDRLSKERS